VLASAAAALGWTALVASSPPRFFAWAAPFAAAWMALSAGAAPPDLRERLRLRSADLALAVAIGVGLYVAARLFLWAFCGGLSTALCGPMADMFVRYRTRAFLPAVALGLVIAPAEELFWRGVVQARLAPRIGEVPAVAAAAAIPTLLALGSGEPFLALATLPTYAVWGLLAVRRGLPAAVVSHALWSVLIAAVVPPP
jgi:membrane protease YdiL (CAAX protease family)